MPIFEYLCEDCGNKFEKLVRRSASENGANGVACPSCGQEHLKQQFSTFAAHANGASHVTRFHALVSLGDVPHAGSVRTELGRTF